MRVLADEAGVESLVRRLADSIEQNMAKRGAGPSGDGWALVGIRSRGDVLARRLAERLGPQRFGHRVGSLDITLYRDDLSEIGPQPIVRTTEIPFAIDRLHVVLVDDVLMTGRSVRAALQSLMDLGRPRRVWLAVLVDRGGRELPIAPDHLALDLTDRVAEALQHDEQVQVQLQPTDPRDSILVHAGRAQLGSGP